MILQTNNDPAPFAPIETNPTVRTLFDDHFVPIRRRVAASTIRKMRHEVNRWEAYGDNPAVPEINGETFNRFRENCRMRGLSPNTIETTVLSVMQILRFAHERGLIPTIPHKGEPLRRYRLRGHVPTIGDLDLLYRFAHRPKWPRLPLWSGEFWQAWLVCSYFTGLRLDDMMHNLFWSNLSHDRLFVRARKTGKEHIFPVPQVLREHLEPLRHLGGERIFPLTKSPHLVRRELATMSREAGLHRTVTPQSLRRLAASEWQSAEWGAGQFLLGHTMGVSDFYMGVSPLLEKAVKKLKVPPAFLEPKIKRILSKPAGDESEQFAKLDEEERKLAWSIVQHVLSLRHRGD